MKIVRIAVSWYHDIKHILWCFDLYKWAGCMNRSNLSQVNLLLFPLWCEIEWHISPLEKIQSENVFTNKS